MPDICMCDNKLCEKKEQCYRYTAPPSPFRQAYSTFVPDKDGFCFYFWPIEEKKV